MSFIDTLIIALGLSMDAFAVALCKGAEMKRPGISHCLLVAVFFGGFQALMPLLGWFLGSSFEAYITAYDHWIAFALLGFIGGKMIYDFFREGEEEKNCGLGIKTLLILAVATSIDALAVGVSVALVGGVDIYATISVIGAVTFILSFVGVVIGKKCGAKLGKKAELAGGIILVLLGAKILLEHLGLLPF